MKLQNHLNLDKASLRNKPDISSDQENQDSERRPQSVGSTLKDIWKCHLIVTFLFLSC